VKRLLIVDDDRYLLDSLRFVFNGLYEVITAPSAEEAAPLLDAQEVDAIILDVILPGINGVEFLQTVRKQHPQVQVIMLSAAASIRPVMKALNLGAVDFIRKPFDIDELRFVVARALHMKQLQERIAVLEGKIVRSPLVPNLEGRPMKELMDEFESELIQKALQDADGVQTRAADMLGTTRRILRYRMEKLHIPTGNTADTL